MEIDFVITLRAYLKEWPPVAHSPLPANFIDRLNIRPEDNIQEVYIEPERGKTALVTFLHLNVVDLDRKEVGGWENLYIPVQEHIADWLRRRENVLFAEFLNVGLQMELLLAILMDQDQIDGTLYSRLLAACGEKGIGVRRNASPAP